ncbi:Protein lethal(2)essential for life [Strongyloides ratti]|uniref:Protein lethal(2)essential for life n=1 Tax=Strongyloides ratti TaxID=34506 RepID=A0A090LFP5_STRRB|nr:Protein lethal(2)essential for life [Strongyloides ratti]CEF66968.1 Protein lethal(2)essential for life [Strongyloides ratti]
MLSRRCVFPLIIRPLKLLNDSILEDLEKNLHSNEPLSNLNDINDKNYVITNDSILLKFDVSQYKPDELSVNFIDGVLVVEGSHEEKDDAQGLVKRHFIRKFNLPKSLKAEDIKSELSKEGIMTIEGKCHVEDDKNVRNIHINVE